jgi:hypothetical protein
MLQFEHAARLHRVVDRRQDVRTVLGKYVLVQPSDGRPAGVVQKPAAIELAHLGPIRTHAIDHVRAGIHQRAEARFAVAQRLLRGNRACFIKCSDEDSSDVPGVVLERRETVDPPRIL